MKEKFLRYLIFCSVFILMVSGCGLKFNYNKEESSLIQKESQSYTEIEALFGRRIRFKTYEPTYFWDSDDDFGSDIDTVFIVSKGGKKVENYHDIESLSAIIFEYDSRFFDEQDEVKERLKGLFDIENLQIEELDSSIFKRHIKGETSEIYVEVYCLEYEGIYYAIELDLYKNDYSVLERDNIIEEYHNIINTLEIID